MPTAVRETIQVLEMIVQGVPLGTNLGLLHLLWAMLNGSFLSSRGAIYPALKTVGLNKEETNRSWSALRYGSWGIEKLVERWRDYVLSEGEWEAHRYEGYRPVAVDWTAFWRPHLRSWVGKMYNSLAGRSLRGIGFGVVVDVGHVGEQRLPLLRRILRIEGEDLSENHLKKETLLWVGESLQEDEIAVMDAGVKLTHCQNAGIKRFVLRLANNFTARRNYLSVVSQRGRPREKGELVRPLPRTRNGKTIAASQADERQIFEWQGRELQVLIWHALILPGLKPKAEHDTFTVLAFNDPNYQDPLLLATNVALQPQSVFALYLDRWPVEQVPLTAKQMIGLHRQYVFATESVLRLPELALLAGNILSYLAAVLPPMPTGFWDRHPKKRLVAYAGSWPKPIFSLCTKNMANFAKRTPSRSIYPRGLRGIAAKNAIPDPFPYLSLSFC